MADSPKIAFLVLDYKKEIETRQCLESIKRLATFDNKEVILLDNGSGDTYPWQIYQDGLCDVLISKKRGEGGGSGQSELWRYTDAEYAGFIQNDQKLRYPITNETVKGLINLIERGYSCVDLNGDQSRKGIWSDRAHFMSVKFFNSLGPFPNGGPGNDAAIWNENYLQEKFKELNLKIAHVSPVFFSDEGKTSRRQAGDGIYFHECDTKLLKIEKQPTYKTEVFPPFDAEDWCIALSGTWPKEGKIPNLWKPHSFRVEHWH